MKNNKMSKKGQEEMVGFGFIILIVAVILIIFITLMINRPEQEIESYEVESFLQSLLQVTSDCEEYGGFMTIKDLSFECRENSVCLDGRDTCDVLNDTLENIVGDVWQIQDRPVEGWSLQIVSEADSIINMTQGNKTANYKGSSQSFFKSGREYKMFFKAYY